MLCQERRLALCKYDLVPLDRLRLCGGDSNFLHFLHSGGPDVTFVVITPLRHCRLVRTGHASAKLFGI